MINLFIRISVGLLLLSKTTFSMEWFTQCVDYISSRTGSTRYMPVDRDVLNQAPYSGCGVIISYFNDLDHPDVPLTFLSTGFVIGKSSVMTAAHSLFLKESRREDIEKKGRDFSKIERFSYCVKFVPADVAALNNFENDEEPVFSSKNDFCLVHFDYDFDTHVFEFKTAPCSKDVTKIGVEKMGYPSFSDQESNKNNVYSTKFSIASCIKKMLLLYNHVTYSGESGSPIVDLETKKVIGMHIGILGVQGTGIFFSADKATYIKKSLERSKTLFKYSGEMTLFLSEYSDKICRYNTFLTECQQHMI